MNLQADLLVLLPELILAIGAMALLLIGAIGGEKTAPADHLGRDRAAHRRRRCRGDGPGHATAFHGAFIADGFSRFAKVLILIGAALSILLADEFFAAISCRALNCRC